MNRVDRLYNLKNVISLVFLLLVTSCTPFKPALYERSVSGLDFSKYQKDGFLITTGDYGQKYQAVSIIRVTCFDGYRKKESENSKQADIWINEDPLYTEKGTTLFRKKDYEYKSCKLSEQLDYMVENAVRLNANGIMNLEITPINQISPVNGKEQNGILIKGLAIRIEDDK